MRKNESFLFQLKWQMQRAELNDELFEAVQENDLEKVSEF